MALHIAAGVLIFVLVAAALVCAFVLDAILSSSDPFP